MWPLWMADPMWLIYRTERPPGGHSRLLGLDRRADWRQDNRTAFMHRHRHLVADFYARQVHERRVKDDSLGIADL